MEKNNRVINIFWALCGFTAVFLFRRNLSAEWFLFAGETQDILYANWVSIFLENPLKGFILTDFFDFINSLLVALLYLGVFLNYYTQRFKIALLWVLMAIFSAAFYSLVSPALAFYNMARVVHFAPGGETLVAIMESAEQSLNILISHGGLPSLLSLAALSCFSLAGLGFSLVFLKDKQKKSWKAWIGIAAHGFALLYIPCSFLFPEFSFIPMVLSAPFMILWHFLLALELLRKKSM
ncbi:MAG: hypothetical protein PF447_06145 [Spirochaetaceae bacterium]|jgi:hypothetical protein|nr:hypothetical protein [Spirochaetaceae bacterium]